MRTWLMKSEPDVFGILHLAAQRIAGWDGVRNYQARNFMRAMRKGDQAFFYHSNAHPPAIAPISSGSMTLRAGAQARRAIVGMMEIVQEAYPDATQFDPQSDHFDPTSSREAPRWDQVDVKFLKVFQRPLSLEEIRELPQLRNMLLIKRSRLSVQPVAPEEAAFILSQVRA